MIDLHSHVLPGLDDGAVDLGAAVEMVRSMAESGVRVVCGTPHVRDDFPTSPRSMEQALELMREAVAEAGIPIELRGGAEIALERLPRLDAGARTRFGLGGDPGLLLLETRTPRGPPICHGCVRGCARTGSCRWSHIRSAIRASRTSRRCSTTLLLPAGWCRSPPLDRWGARADHCTVRAAADRARARAPDRERRARPPACRRQEWPRPSRQWVGERSAPGSRRACRLRCWRGMSCRRGLVR